MLTFTFLGVGSAFAKRNHQSNVLVEAWSLGPAAQDCPDDTLLIDFGTTGPQALHQLKERPGFEYLARQDRIYYPAIHKVFITHQHADHIGGLEELALTNMFSHGDPQSGRCFRPQIISSEQLLESLWDHSLKGGLDAIPGRRAVLEDFFTAAPVRPGQAGRGHFTMLDRYRFDVLPTDHIRIEHKHDWPSYALLIRDLRTDESVYYSGDSRLDRQATDAIMAAAKLCFHDVQLIEQPDPVHTLLTELRALPADIKRKTRLYHYSDVWDSGDFDFVADEFAGFAEAQRRYVLFE